MFFVKEETIWEKNYNMQKTHGFKENPDMIFLEFINDNIKYIKKFKLNPYKLIFYSPISRDYSTSDIIKLTKATHSYIKGSGLTFSLNETHSPLGFDEPLMSSFFYSSGSNVLDANLVSTLIECGLEIDEEFYNNILRLLHHSYSYNIETKKKWDFIALLSILKESLPIVKLDEKNVDYLLELVNDPDNQ